MILKRKRTSWSKNKIKSRFKELKGELGSVPTKQEVRKNYPALESAIDRYFDGINELKRELGYKIVHEMNKWNKEKAIKEYKKLADKLGYPPNQKELEEKRNDIYKAIMNHVGSFNKAREIAGFKTNPPHGLRNELNSSAKDITPEFCYVFGVILGDGTILENNSNAWIMLKVKDKEFANRFKEKVEEWSGLNASKHKRNGREKRFPNGITSKSSDTLGVKLSSRNAVELIEEKIENDEWIKETDEEGKEELLKGLWDSEGSTRGNCTISFYNSDTEILDLYKKLVREVIGVEEFNEYSRENGSVQVSFNGKENVEEFKNKIGFTISRKEISPIEEIEQKSVNGKEYTRSFHKWSEEEMEVVRENEGSSSGKVMGVLNDKFDNKYTYGMVATKIGRMKK